MPLAKESKTEKPAHTLLSCDILPSCGALPVGLRYPHPTQEQTGIAVGDVDTEEKEEKGEARV